MDTEKPVAAAVAEDKPAGSNTPPPPPAAPAAPAADGKTN